MPKVVLLGFSEATIPNDILNFFTVKNQEAYIVNPYEFLNGNYNSTDKFLITVTKDQLLRKELINKLDTDKLERATFIHDTAVINQNAKIGKGSIIWQFVSILHHASIGSDCMISPYSMVAHQTNIGSGTIMLPGSMVGGTSTIGNHCLLGLRSSVIDKINVCDDVIIGAGSLVTKHILYSGRYVGSPARKINVDIDTDTSYTNT